MYAIVFLLAVLNSDFEFDSVSSASYLVPSGWVWSGSGPPVSGSYGVVLVPNGDSDSVWGGGTAPSGVNYIALQAAAGSTAAVSQYCVIPAGSTITFYLRYGPVTGSSGSNSVTLTVSYGSTVLSTITLPPSATIWTLKTTATSISSIVTTAQFLTFAVSSGSGSGFQGAAEIDNMIVTPGPS